MNPSILIGAVVLIVLVLFSRPSQPHSQYQSAQSQPQQDKLQASQTTHKNVPVSVPHQMHSASAQQKAHVQLSTRTPIILHPGQMQQQLRSSVPNEPKSKSAVPIPKQTHEVPTARGQQGAVTASTARSSEQVQKQTHVNAPNSKSQKEQSSVQREPAFKLKTPGEILLAAIVESLLASDLSSQRKLQVADHYPDAVPFPTTLHTPTAPYTPTSPKTETNNTKMNKPATASKSGKAHAEAQQHRIVGRKGVNISKTNISEHRVPALGERTYFRNNNNTNSSVDMWNEKIDKIWKEASIDALMVAVPSVFLMLLVVLVVARFTCCLRLCCCCCCCCPRCCRQEVEVCAPDSVGDTRRYAPLSDDEEVDEESREGKKPEHTGQKQTRGDSFTDANVRLPSKSTGARGGGAGAYLIGADANAKNYASLRISDGSDVEY